MVLANTSQVLRNASDRVTYGQSSMTAKRLKIQVGRAYFMCGFYLRHIPIPEIETWIYVGADVLKNDNSDGQKYNYFQRPEVYFENEIREEYAEHDVEQDSEVESTLERSSLIRVSEEDLDGLVYDYRGLCHWVSGLSKEPNAEDYF